MGLRFVWLDVDDPYRTRRALWKLLGRHGRKVRAIMLVVDVGSGKEVSGLSAGFGFRVGLEEFLNHVYGVWGVSVERGDSGVQGAGRLWVANR